MNVEGEYSEIGGRLNRGFPDEMAVQESVFTRVGVSRIADYAFELARSRRGYVTSATKSNGIVHTLPFWDQVVAERAGQFPDVRWDSEHIDALAAKFVLAPQRFDIAGQGIANPVGAVWSAALMLEHLGHRAAADDVMAAIEATLADPQTRTGDLGGRASTAQVTESLVARLR